MELEVKKVTEGRFDAQLFCKNERENEITITHCNDNDGHYCYKFIIKGTKEEIKIVKQFCSLVSGQPRESEKYESYG